MTTNQRVVLIDGNSLLYRAFFAMPHFSTLENQPTNAVYGFTMMLLKLIEEGRPEIIIVAFDAPSKTFRHEEFAEYKAHRKETPDDLKSQGPLAREVVEALGIPLLEVPGYEGDDLIGTLARMAEHDGYDVTIVTGDKDALQLVDDKVSVMITVKGVTETVIYDEAAVEARFGIKPCQLIDYKALMGDSSDNIPGVRGIGEKTAGKLIKEFVTLDNLYENVESVSSAKIRELLITHSDLAVMSKRLATIVTDVPIDIHFPDCHYGNMDAERVGLLFKKLGFRSLMNKIPSYGKTESKQLIPDILPVKPNNMQNSLFDEPVQVVLPSAECIVVTTASDIAALIEEARRSGAISIRIHGNSERGVSAEALGIAVETLPEKSYYVAFNEDTGVSLDSLRALFEDAGIEKYGHNLKFEYEVCRRYGVSFNGPAFDVMLAGYVLDPTRANHALTELAFDYIGIELPIRDAKIGRISRSGIMHSEAQYYAEQADAIRKLVPVLKGRLLSDKLTSLMMDIEMPLVPILAEMEYSGVAIDREWLFQLSERFGKRIHSLEAEIFELAGTEFNIGSPKQLQYVLFDTLGLPSTKKTKTGYSTDADTLAALAPVHDIVSKILEYRELTKLKSTYADSLPKLIDERTGRIHTSLNQAVTATGRLSSSEPNLQNIPIKTEIGREIRRAFVASPGNVLVSADYSQIELRILAHVSQDPKLIASYKEEEDIHTKTASKLFDVPVSEVTSDMRRQAKTVNFAVIYGMSDYGLSRELNISPSTAKIYIQEYFHEYPGVKTYTTKTLELARSTGYVESLYGRRRYMPELANSNRNVREFAERAAVNMPIQGTAADIVKLAMIRVCDQLKSQGLKSLLVLQVHDDLVFDAPEAELPILIPMIREAMENAVKLDVPLKVEIKVGKDWCIAEAIIAEDFEYIENRLDF